MQPLTPYLPILLVVCVTIASLFITDSNRNERCSKLLAQGKRIFSRDRSKNGAGDARTKRLFTLRRMLVCSVVLFLLSYVWTYQRVQQAIAVELAANGMQEINIGSLIMPYTAFFQTAYVADAGFSYTKKRARAEVSVRGHPLSELLWGKPDAQMGVRINQAAFVRINDLIGKKFVFSYLTDVETLRPAIEQYMQQLLRGKQIDKYEIETFDNRGPYLIVALHASNRSKDVQAVATSFAQGLYTELTKSHQLKVNQVVVKVVEPQPYILRNTIQVIGRGVVTSE